MRAHTTLATILLACVTTSSMETARIAWNNKYSPKDGYLRIHHRSQKKKRRLARQHNTF